MADAELDALLERITAARDFAHHQARSLLAEMRDDPDPLKDGVRAHLGSNFRCTAQVLNVILGLDPDEGDDYTGMLE